MPGYAYVYPGNLGSLAAWRSAKMTPEWKPVPPKSTEGSKATWNNCASDCPRCDFLRKARLGCVWRFARGTSSHMVLQSAALIGRSWFRPQANHGHPGTYLSPASPTLHVLTLSPFLVTTPNADPSIIPEAPVPRACRKRNVCLVYLTFLDLTRTISAASRISPLHPTCISFFPLNHVCVAPCRVYTSKPSHITRSVTSPRESSKTRDQTHSTPAKTITPKGT